MRTLQKAVMRWANRPVCLKVPVEYWAEEESGSDSFSKQVVWPILIVLKSLGSFSSAQINFIVGPQFMTGLEMCSLAS